MGGVCGVFPAHACLALISQPLRGDFAFGGRSDTLLMDHGTMSRLMFGLIKATRPPRKMIERMRQMCVPCVVKSAAPSPVVVSAGALL